MKCDLHWPTRGTKRLERCCLIYGKKRNFSHNNSPKLKLPVTWDGKEKAVADRMQVCLGTLLLLPAKHASLQAEPHLPNVVVSVDLFTRDDLSRSSHQSTSVSRTMTGPLAAWNQKRQHKWLLICIATTKC